LERGAGMTSLQTFLDDEDGAVTVDWVVLTSAIVILAIAVMPPVREAVVTLTIGIAATIDEYQKFLE
jgi:Flp pilus assembly pilin Flp